MQPKRIFHNWKLLLSLLLLFSVVVLAVARKNRWFYQPQQAEYNAGEELKKLYNRYMSAAAGFDIGGKVSLYDMEQNNALKEWSVFRNVKQGTNFYSSMAGQQTFLYNGLWMQVDSTQKMITMAAVNTMEPLPAEGAGLPLDKYLSDTSLLQVHAAVTGNDSVRVLQLRNELTPEMKSVAVYYRPQDYTITRMEIQWWKTPPSLQTQKENACWLSVIQLEPAHLQPFSINGAMAGVVKPVGNEWKTTGQYRNYELTVTTGNTVTYP